ncbi:MAG: hypothetical protein P8I80_06790 [Bacteroidales bacterium]|nr:hypothetical protein [Bacteroidales bacterium]MDG2081070.1 hypothetical protein [Bacteroidales bacterium]
MKIRLILIMSLMILFANMHGQFQIRDSVVAAFLPNLSYSYQFPGGDISKKYGDNSTIGVGLKYKTKKNFMYSFDINFIFGNEVKNADSILWMVETSDGHIMDGNGLFALYTLYERGYNLNFSIGKIFPILNPNPNSGLLISGGVGYMLTRMKIDNQNQTAPQISGDYAKGYDMLTGGISLNQFVGWYFMSNSRVLNFYGGFEFQQAFTKNLRDWDFQSKQKDNNNYFDYFIGIKIGWMIPIYKRAPDNYYYN